MLATFRPPHTSLAHLRRLLALTTLACLPLVACGSDATGPDAVRSDEGTAGNQPATDVTTPVTSPVADTAIATVVYEFHDSSVAPEYHRSYTVTVTAGSATVVVDSYGDVIAQDTQPIDDVTWRATVDAAAALAGTASSENTGCAGGTSDELTALDAAGADVVHVFVDHCDSPGGPDLSIVVSSVLSLFDLGTMTATS